MDERTVKVEAKIMAMLEAMTPRERELLLEVFERRDELVGFPDGHPRRLAPVVRSFIMACK